MPAGTPVSNDLFSQALQQALQASSMSGMSSLQVSLFSFPPLLYSLILSFPSPLTVLQEPRGQTRSTGLDL